MKDPSTWSMNVVPAKDAYELVFHVDLDAGWHVYALDPGGDGSFIPPSFEFDKGAYVRSGKIREVGTLVEEAAEGVDGKVRYFKGKADFIQTIKAKPGATVKGSYTYQLCNESICLPPKTKPFLFRTP
jgi:thiol:disulfide interchange protein DsbD